MSDTLLVEARHELGRLPTVLETLLAGLDEVSARTRPAPGEWSPVEILCHLRDEETEDFGARLRVIVDGASEFAPIAPERWAEERRYREVSLPDVLEALRPGEPDPAAHGPPTGMALGVGLGVGGDVGAGDAVVAEENADS